MKAGTVGKLILGVLLFLAGIYWYIGYKIPPYYTAVPFFETALHSLKIIFEGVFGLLLILVGGLLAWLEWDELKTSREIAAAEKKTKKRK